MHLTPFELVAPPQENLRRKEKREERKEKTRKDIILMEAG